MSNNTITIPSDLLPADGRFCSGPSKVRPEAVQALADRAHDYMGTSHRQMTVRFKVAELRNGLAELFALPDGYEVLLGNGGATGFWDAATFGLIERRSHHLSFGEFGSKFVKASAAAPHLEAPEVVEADPGSRPDIVAGDDVDAYCYPHNETSTGVFIEPARPAADGLVLVDATSGAGGMRFDPTATDVYYFAPQKCFAADGGIWIALCSPTAIERIESIAASDRWCPASLDLKIALDNSRKDQTYNTPALGTIFITAEQVNWMNGNGGLSWAADRCKASSDHLYGWAEASDVASPFVTDASMRSPVVGTIDFDERVDANQLSDVLRANGILDTEGYRKLGRNQIRIGMFPAVETTDVEALTNCIDFLVEHL